MSSGSSPSAIRSPANPFTIAQPGSSARPRPLVPTSHSSSSVPLTTTRRGLSLHVEVEPSATTGLDVTSYVQCELLRSLDRRRLVHRLGTVDPATSRHVGTIVRTLLNHRPSRTGRRPSIDAVRA